MNLTYKGQTHDSYYYSFVFAWSYYDRRDTNNLDTLDKNERLGKEISVNQMARGAKERVMKEIQGNNRAGFL